MREEREERFSEISTGFLIVRTDEAMKDIVVSFGTLHFTAGKLNKTTRSDSSETTAFDYIVQYSIILYNVVQYCTIEYTTVQYCTIEYTTVQCSTIFYTTVQCSKILYNRVQHCTIKYNTMH